MKNNIALLLTCQRRALGLNISEMADMLGIDKRVISFVERGERKPAQDHLGSMALSSTHYDVLINCLKRDIDSFKLQNPLPITDDSDEYFKLVKHVKRLTLPFFNDFEQFKAATSNESKSYWRIWQAAISHLVTVGSLHCINDDTPIPASFKQTHFWLDMNYDVLDLAEDVQ